MMLLIRYIQPFDNLVMAVTLKEDGSTDKKVLGSLTEAVKAQSSVEAGLVKIKGRYLQVQSFRWFHLQ